MNCKEFRKQHCLYVDDTLPGIDIVRMQRHINECESCADLDVRVRRSLMVVRNMGTIQPSQDFSTKLAARLLECKREVESPSSDDHLISFIKSSGNVGYIGGFGALASALMLGYAAIVYSKLGSPLTHDIMLPAVIAVAQPPQGDRPDDPNQNATENRNFPEVAILGSISATMPMVMSVDVFAEQVSHHLVNKELNK